MSVATTTNRIKTPLWLRRSRFGQKITPYLFLTPFLAGFLVFMVYPLIYALNFEPISKKTGWGHFICRAGELCEGFPGC